MAELVIDHLRKAFGGPSQPVVAVEDFNLSVADGEFVTLLGPSGCGKSTTLAAVAGLDRPTGGSIRAGSHVYVDCTKRLYLPPEQRNCGLVFQSYALWPHMSVFDNVAFALKLRKVGKKEQQRRVHEALALVEMESFVDRYPHQLSGGQQQRVALARTLVYRPEVLLLDEPLSNLDAKLRDRARTWLGELRTRLKLTTLYVTHDQLEALALSDRIVVMNKGRIEQIGTPQDIYERPANAFVADFIGTTNFLEGCRVESSAPDGVLEVSLPNGERIRGHATSGLKIGDEAMVAFRPEHLAFVDRSALDSRYLNLEAEIDAPAYIGGKWQIAVRIGGSTLRLETLLPPSSSRGAIGISRSDGIVFPARKAA